MLQDAPNVRYWWKSDIVIGHRLTHRDEMYFDPPLLSFRRIKWTWHLHMALRAERLKNAEAGLRHIERASDLGSLPFTGEVIRAQLLLQSKRVAAAQDALSAIIAHPVWPKDAARQTYLKAYCEHLLACFSRHACVAEMGKIGSTISGVSFLWRDRFPIPDCRYCDMIKGL